MINAFKPKLMLYDRIFYLEKITICNIPASCCHEYCNRKPFYFMKLDLCLYGDSIKETKHEEPLIIVFCKEHGELINGDNDKWRIQ